jgi:Zn-dependent M28 family amino/carboxypeptidase
MNKLAWTACAASLLCSAGAGAQDIDSLAIRGHTRFLADDLLTGRGTGTAGERLAAAYIISQLERLGLDGLAADGGYLLPVPLKAAIIDPATSLTLRRGGGSSRFASGRDFVVNTGGSGAFRNFSGPLWFAGPPRHALASLRTAGALHGRVAVVTGALGAAASELIPALIEGDAAGVIVLVQDSAQFDLFVRSRGDRRFFVAADVGDPVWQPDLPVLLAGPSLARAILEGAAVPANDSTAATAVDLARSATVEIRTRTVDVQAANVGGVLRGSDPAAQDELVVYTAHYDHLGVSTPTANGDSIYNGFSDNAAGVAMLLAIAEAFREAPPRRSVAFLFFTGEERGLLGSSFLAAQPPFPLQRVVGLINLDAGAPPAAPVTWRLAGGNASSLGALAVRVAARSGWRAEPGDASPNSDYWPFLTRNVPAVFIIPGSEWEGVNAEQRDALRKRWDHYHQASDHWAEDFPFAGLTRYAHFAAQLGLELAR